MKIVREKVSRCVCVCVCLCFTMPRFMHPIIIYSFLPFNPPIAFIRHKCTEWKQTHTKNRINIFPANLILDFCHNFATMNCNNGWSDDKRNLQLCRSRSAQCYSNPPAHCVPFWFNRSHPVGCTQKEDFFRHICYSFFCVVRMNKCR